MFTLIIQMPGPRKSNKSRRSTRTTKSKASSKPSGLAKRTPYAGKYAFKPSGRRMVIKQANLGEQTANTCRLGPLTKPDTRARYMKAVSAPSTYNRLRNWNIYSGSTGIQGIAGQPIAPQSDLRLIADSLQNYLFSGSSSTGTAVNAPARFLLQDVHEVYDFANRSTAPCTLKIYIVEAKRDTWYSTGTPMVYNSPNGATVSWDGTPIDAVRAGIQAQSDPFQSNPLNDDWQNPGMLPTQSVIFNQYFKIDKEYEVEMAQGGVHQLTLNAHYDKVCDASVYANTPLVAVRGVTRFLMAFAVGTPVIVTGMANQMTTSAVTIGVIQTIKYKYTQCASPVAVAFQDGTPGELAQVAYNAVYQTNPGSGGINPVDEA